MSKYGNIFEWFLPQNMANLVDFFQTNPLGSPFFWAIYILLLVPSPQIHGTKESESARKKVAG
jgi:hypothetical protein